MNMDSYRKHAEPRSKRQNGAHSVILFLNPAENFPAVVVSWGERKGKGLERGSKGASIYFDTFLFWKEIQSKAKME